MLDRNTHVEMLMNDNQVGATLPSKWEFDAPGAWDRACNFMDEMFTSLKVKANLTEHGQDGPCTVQIAKDDANDALDPIAKKWGGRAEPRAA